MIMSMSGCGSMWHVVDSTLGLVLFFAAKLAYLRGTWDLWGCYIYPGINPKSEWVMTAVGGLGTLTFGYLVCPQIDRWLVPLQKEKRVGYILLCFVVTRTCFYAQAAINIAFMRGIWDLEEFYVGNNYGWHGRLGVFLCSYAALILLKASRSCLTVPFLALLDNRPSVLVPSSRFAVKVQWRSALSILKYILDAIATQCVIGTLISLVWSGYLMFLIDVIVVSADPALSAGCCMAVGGSACAIFSIFLERPLVTLGTKIESKHSKWAKLLYHDILFLAVYLCQGSFWGGAWRLDKMYILPDLLIGGWIHHGVGTVLLAGLQIFSSSIAGVGCAVDGSGSSADVIFPKKYLSAIKSVIVNTKSKEKTDKKTMQTNDLFHVTTKSVDPETIPSERLDSCADTSAANPVPSVPF